jgi:hypothetical protein
MAERSAVRPTVPNGAAKRSPYSDPSYGHRAWLRCRPVIVPLPGRWELPDMRILRAYFRPLRACDETRSGQSRFTHTPMCARRETSPQQFASSGRRVH